MNIWTPFTNLQPNVIAKLAAHRNRIYCYSLHHIQLSFVYTTLKHSIFVILPTYKFSLIQHKAMDSQYSSCFTFYYRFSNKSLINNWIRRGNKIYNAGWHTKNWPVPLKLSRTDWINFDSTYSFTINGIMDFESRWQQLRFSPSWSVQPVVTSRILLRVGFLCAIL